MMRESPFIFPLSTTEYHGIYLPTQSRGYSGNNYYDRSNSSIPVRRSILTSFFIKPKLKIASIHVDENIDRRWGKTEQRYRVISEDRRNAELPYEYYPLRRFINVTVENQGNDPAKNCEIVVKLLEKNDGCIWLSSGDKSLVWDDGTTHRKGGKAVFHFAFSQQSFTPNQETLISELFCGVNKNNFRAISWVGTLKALESPEYSDQDGLCPGKFRIHVEIATENGHSVVNHLTIKMGDTWKDLEADSLEDCNCDKS